MSSKTRSAGPYNGADVLILRHWRQGACVWEPGAEIKVLDIGLCTMIQSCSLRRV